MRGDRGRLRNIGKDRLGGQVGSVDLGPGVDDGENLRRLKVCEGQVVRRGESDDIAFASD